MASSSSDFARLMEVDIGKASQSVDLPFKRKRNNSCHQMEHGPPGSLCIHFSRLSPLQTRGERYRWVSKVLRMEPYKHVNGAIELRDGRQNIYVKCKNADILTRLTTVGALGEILVRPKVYGKRQCMNIIVFDVPFCVEMQELTEYNPQIVHARRIHQNGNPTQRVIITYEGDTAPKTLKVVEGLSALRCAIFHSLTPFCSHCSKWGHSYRGCPRDVPRCMYCACLHLSKECAEKIARNELVPRKCVNCRCDHNANSPLCTFYPKDRKKKNDAAKPPSASLTLAPVPCIDDVKVFPSLPRRIITPPRPVQSSGVPRGWTPAPKMQHETSSSQPPEVHTKPVPPGPPVSYAPKASIPAAPTSDQDTEANIFKEMLQSMKEMLQTQTNMLQAMMAFLQQQMSQQQQRHEQLLASFFGAQQQQANVENI